MREVGEIVADHFWSRVDRSGDGCWPWLGGRITEGYGIYYPPGCGYDAMGAHRRAYELTVGPIPEGLVIDHLCRTPCCVRPDHLEAVTQRENTLRGVSPAALNAKKVTCKRGHPFDDANTYLKNGQRLCRECRVAATRAWRRRKKEEAAA